MAPIVLIRHAQSEHHVGGLTGGWTDTDLTELGQRQTECLAERLKRETANTPCLMYCSDLRRAQQTADIIGRALGVTPEPTPELREFNNGIAAGMSQEEAEQYTQEEPPSAILDWQPYPEAETWREFHTRVSAYMDRLVRSEEKLPLVVTHGGTIINIVAWWLQLEVEMLGRVSFAASPASISVLRLNQWGERTIERLNDTSHLYAAGLSDGLRLSR